MAWTTPGTAVAGDVLTAAFWNQQVRDNMNSLVASGTTLPSSPTDGESFYYIADSTNGVIWHLRYRSGSSSSYKWEFVGGSMLYSRDSNQRTTASTTYQTTGSPTITLPFAGDYECTFGASSFQNNAAAANAFVVALHVNAVEVAFCDGQAATNGYVYPASHTLRHTGASASYVADVRYKSSSGLSMSVNRMFLSIRPVRVG